MATTVTKGTGHRDWYKTYLLLTSHGKQREQRGQFKWISLSKGKLITSAWDGPQWALSECGKKTDGVGRAKQESQPSTAINTPSRQLGRINWKPVCRNSERSTDRILHAQTLPSKMLTFLLSSQLRAPLRGLLCREEGKCPGLSSLPYSPQSQDN